MAPKRVGERRDVNGRGVAGVLQGSTRSSGGPTDEIVTSSTNTPTAGGGCLFL